MEIRIGRADQLKWVMKMVISRRDIYRKRSRAILKSVMKMAVGDDFWKRVDVRIGREAEQF